MDLKLVVDNSDTMLTSRRDRRQRPQDRVPAAWRAMRGVMNDHLQGKLSDQVATMIIYGYLDDSQLNSDMHEIGR
jgi:hypothetical protein